MALAKIGLDEDQVQEIVPIQFDDYYYENISASSWNYKVLHKWGKDQRYRSSNYYAGIFFFSAEQIYYCEVEFSLLEDQKLEKTYEYFYRDVVSVATVSDFILRGFGAQLTQSLGLIPCVGPILAMLVEMFWPKDKTISFTLTTSGNTSISAAVYDSEAVERSVQGMKSLLRSKKQQSQR